MIKDFIKELLNEINKIKNCYYEEVPFNASYPYLVVQNITISSLEQGNICYFDIEIYNNELSVVNIEDICDQLIVGLDRLVVHRDKVSFHLAFEKLNINNYNEQDETSRTISFIARIFS